MHLSRAPAPGGRCLLQHTDYDDQLGWVKLRRALIRRLYPLRIDPLPLPLPALISVVCVSGVGVGNGHRTKSNSTARMHPKLRRADDKQTEMRDGPFSGARAAQREMTNNCPQYPAPNCGAVCVGMPWPRSASGRSLPSASARSPHRHRCGRMQLIGSGDTATACCGRVSAKQPAESSTAVRNPDH